MSGSILVRIAVDDKGNPAIQKLGKSAQQAQKVVQPLGETLKQVFTALGAYQGIQYFVNGLKQAAVYAAQFENSIIKISAITGTSGKELQTLSDTARDLALKTEHSATAIASAMLEMTKMGMTTEDTLKAIYPIMNLATAATEDLGWSAENTVNIIKAFNMDFSETERVSNVVATALNLTSLNLKQYMEAMQYVGPVAKSMNMSLEETTAILGFLSDISIKGSLGGTSLKNTLLNLLKPGKEVSDALRDANLEGKTLTDVFQILNSAGVSVSGMLKALDKRAITSGLAMKDNVPTIKELTEKLYAQGTTSEEVAEKMRQSILSVWKEMINKLNELGLNLGDTFGPIAKKALDSFNKWLIEADKWMDKNKDSIDKVVKVVSTDLVRAFEQAYRYIKLIKDILDKLFITALFETGLKNLQWWVDKIQSITDVTQQAVDWLGKLIDKFDIIGKLKKDTAANEYGADKYTSEEHLKYLSDMLEIYKRAEMGIFDVKAANEILIDSLVSYKEKMGKTAFSLLAGNDDKVTLEEIQKKHKEVYTALYGNAPGVVVADTTTVRGGKTTAEHYMTEEEKEKARKNREKEIKERDKLEMELFEASKKIAEEEWNLQCDRWEEEEKREKDAFEANMSLKERMAEKGDELIEQSNQYRQKKSEESAQKILDDIKATEEFKQQFIIDTAFNTANLVTDIWAVANANQLASFENRMEKESKALERRYKIETIQAGDNALRRQIAEEKYQDAKKRMQDEYDAKKKEIAEKEKIREIAIGTINALAAGVGAAKDTKGNVGVRIAAGLTMLGFGLAQVATIAATQTYRTGSQGPIHGDGNSSSDSILAKLSKGEWVLNRNDVNKLGGDESLRMALDRGSSYTSNKKEVHLHNVIGTEEFVRRQVIPIIETELSR